MLSIKSWDSVFIAGSACVLFLALCFAQTTSVSGGQRSGAAQLAGRLRGGRRISHMARDGPLRPRTAPLSKAIAPDAPHRSSRRILSILPNYRGIGTWCRMITSGATTNPVGGQATWRHRVSA